VFFEELLSDICNTQDALEEIVAGIIDRPLEQLDPVELGILLIGVYELESRIDIPYRVVINEGVNLAKRFGAMDGHKYINACLDAAAQSLRKVEVEAEGGG
jgi:N utilization substance protein B